jgi:osmoprotectant transport system permease protein
VVGRRGEVGVNALLASISVSSVTRWFTDGANWRGANGIPHRLAEHVQLSAVALAVACLVAVPIGIVLGHLGKGGLVALNVANVGRAIPSLAILIVAVPLVGIGQKPAYLALIALAVPPILTNTYVAMRQVDPEVKDAARGMGMTGLQMVTRVELRLALPLTLAGVRTSAFQVIATATLAAEVAAGGLGRYIVDGLAVRDDTQVFAGALLVVVLALLVEGLFAGLQRVLVPSAVRGPRSYTPDPLLEDTNETLHLAA